MKSKQVQEFKETEIGKIPIDWAVEKLQDHLIIKGRIGWKGLKTSIHLIDSAGRLVKKWMDSQLNHSVGSHRVSGDWNLMNESGRRVSSGAYLFLLRVNNQTKASWIIALK